MLFFSGSGSGSGELGLRLCTYAFPHIDGAHRAVCIHSPRRTFLRAGADRLFHASGFSGGQQIPLVHNAEKVGFILLALLIHGLVIINDNVKGIAAAGLDGNKLLVGVLVIEQITGYKVSLPRKSPRPA